MEARTFTRSQAPSLETISRTCLHCGTKMQLISGHVYDGVAICPHCKRLEELDSVGGRLIPDMAHARGYLRRPL